MVWLRLLKNMKKMAWKMYSRGTIHLHRLSPCIIAVREMSQKLVGTPNDKILYLNIGSKLWWAWDIKQIKDTGRHILNLISDKKKADKHFKQFLVWTKQAIKASDKIRKQDLTKLTNQDLIKAYDFVYDQSKAAHGAMMPVIDVIDIVFDDFFFAKVKKELKDSTKVSFVYKKLAQSYHQSYITKQEIAIIKVSLKTKITTQDIAKLHHSFWWTSLGWENMQINNKKYFEQQVKKYKKQKNTKKKLQELQTRDKKIKQERRKLIKQYNFSKDIEYWLWILDKYTYFHDIRKEMQVQTMYTFYLLMSEVARRLNLDKEDLEWLLVDEIKDLLNGQALDNDEVVRRKQATCFISHGDTFDLYSGQSAKEKLKKYIPNINKNINKFKGIGVTQGKIRGRVKVCAGAQEAFSKIKTGDILVCGMTLPDYVPAMKKSAAIITDEGGITCHAAIISRELNIPCVVGTKIATQVLQDNDLVDLDANNGIIKKII